MTDEAFDRAALFARVDGDEELLAEIVNLYLEDCPRLLADIQQALARKDASQLKMAAHTLKGSVGNFCAPPAFEVAARLDREASTDQLDGAELSYEALKAELDRLNQGLARLLPESAAP